MGKRKSSKKPAPKKARQKLDVTFACPFCNSGMFVGLDGLGEGGILHQLSPGRLSRVRPHTPALSPFHRQERDVRNGSGGQHWICELHAVLCKVRSEDSLPVGAH